jgi:hypothetical protein
MTDVLLLIILILILLVSFGVAIQSLLYPERELSTAMMREALYSPFFDMFGSMLTLERLAGNISYTLYALVNCFPQSAAQSSKNDQT